MKSWKYSWPKSLILIKFELKIFKLQYHLHSGNTESTDLFRTELSQFKKQMD